MSTSGGSRVQRSKADRVRAAQCCERHALRDGVDEPAQLVETFRLRSGRQNFLRAESYVNVASEIERVGVVGAYGGGVTARAVPP